MLVFDPSSDHWWISLLACGRYRHVRACAYVKTTRLWLFYDVTLSPTLVMALPDGDAAAMYFHDFTKGCDLVRIAPSRRRGLQFSPLTCVSAIKRLIGLKSRALRPDRLFRDCIAAGGRPLEDRIPTAAPAVHAAAAGSDGDSVAAAI